ncbi:glycosyltransferase family 2 protein [Patescibacteria group bacterium]|nr:glycosyltransferase family 2 protein [Patescibacteria group bacterium]
MKLSIIIPVFNEEKTIKQILEKVEGIKIPGVDKEVIVVDDGSTDNSKFEIQSAKGGSKSGGIKKIFHKKNQGKGAAVRTGIEAATGDYILIQDADLEYDPNDIKRLILPVQKEKAKVVYGTRLNRLPNLTKDESKPLFLIHYFGNRFLSLITSILYRQWITDMETCYKLFPREALKSAKLNSKRFDFEPEITSKLLKKGYKILEIPIVTKPRGYDEGKKLNAIKDGSIALWTLLKYRFVN